MIPIYWINLDESIDRRQNMNKQLTEHQIWNKRIIAIKHENPMIGCCLSHIKLIHQAWLDGHELIVGCEDDVDLSDGTNIFTNINNILNTLPSDVKNDWDVIQIQYTEPHFSLELNNYFHKYINLEGNLHNLYNRVIKGYLYGYVAYLMNRRGMEKFLKLMTTQDINDKNTYIVTANFDHPRAHSEELVYRYINSYMPVFPIFNYLPFESTINNKPGYYLENEKNRNMTNNNKKLLNNNNYKLVKNEQIYELPYDLHWFVNGNEEAYHVVNKIFTEY